MLLCNRFRIQDIQKAILNIYQFNFSSIMYVLKLFNDNYLSQLSEVTLTE